MPLEALVFDVDGTLAETEEVHRQAFNETFAAFGLAWHWSAEDYHGLLKTTGGKERMRAHAKAAGEPIPDDLVAAIHKAKTERYGEIIASGAVGLRPGIAGLIALAQREGLRLAIATTTNRPNVDILIRATFGAEPGEMFEAIAAGDEVAAKKPAPDVFLLAARRLGIAPARCLAFEDSANGLKSALGAGMPVVVSPSRYTADEDFTGAAAVLATYENLTLTQLARLAGKRRAA